MTDPAPVRPRTLIALLVAVTALIVGLLSMHVLGGGSHDSHEAGALAGVHASQVDAPDHAGLDCGTTGCEGMELMAMGCVLALLGLAVLFCAAPRRWSLRTSAPPFRVPTALERALPRPSLVELSISRT